MKRAAPRVHGEGIGEDGAGASRPVFAAVYLLVEKIPKGRVMTYGQIASLIENRLSPRAVGWAMHGCPKGLPWQRVVNASGGCSTDRLADMPRGMQRVLLEAEGVKFKDNGTLPLEKYRWVPPAARRPAVRRPAARRRPAAAGRTRRTKSR